MNDHASAFSIAHSNSTVQAVAELVHAINSNAVTFRSVSENCSLKELASTYAVRSKIAESQGHETRAIELSLLTKEFQKDEENSCAIWVFEGATTSFVAFELVPSKTIAGCFKFEGRLGDPKNVL